MSATVQAVPWYLSTPERVEQLRERLLRLSFVELDPTCPDLGPCWPWLGTRTYKGYGLLSMRRPGRRSPIGLRAHRVSFEIFKGRPILPDMTLDHECEREFCICPDHLVEISVAGNTSLMHERARARLAERQSWGGAR